MDFELELEDKSACETASSVKDPDASFVRDCGGNLPTVDDLNKLEAELNAELETALASADAVTIFSIRERLSKLPLMRTAAGIEATRNRLREIELALQQNEETKRLIRSVIVKRKLELQQKLDEIQPFYERLNKASNEQGFADNECQLLLIERREKKNKLRDLTADLKNGAGETV